MVQIFRIRTESFPDPQTRGTSSDTRHDVDRTKAFEISLSGKFYSGNNKLSPGEKKTERRFEFYDRCSLYYSFCNSDLSADSYGKHNIRVSAV